MYSDISEGFIGCSAQLFILQLPVLNCESFRFSQRIYRSIFVRQEPSFFVTYRFCLHYSPDNHLATIVKYVDLPIPNQTRLWTTPHASYSEDLIRYSRGLSQFNGKTSTSYDQEEQQSWLVLIEIRLLFYTIKRCRRTRGHDLMLAK